MDETNDVFKAMSDASRRELLDQLHKKDGQTLNELCQYLDMSRFGVMKHLNILEEANLLTTKKVGREKYHYLNPVPIRLIYERWVSKYAEPWVTGLTALKEELEWGRVEEKPNHVYRIAIKATPEQIWDSLTDPDKCSKFWHNGKIESQWRNGAPYVIRNQQGKVQAEGELIVVEPPHKLVMSWQLLALSDTADEDPSRLSWEITPHPDLQHITLITVVHDEWTNSPHTAKTLETGFPIVLSGMKTLLETGNPM